MNWLRAKRETCVTAEHEPKEMPVKDVTKKEAAGLNGGKCGKRNKVQQTNWLAIKGDYA